MHPFRDFVTFFQIIFQKDTFSFIPQLTVLKNKQQNLNCHGFLCYLNKYKWSDSVTNVNKQVIWKFWRRKWQPTPVLLPGERHVWRSLVGYIPWGHKESDTTERPSTALELHMHSLDNTGSLEVFNIFAKLKKQHTILICMNIFIIRGTKHSV